MLVPVAATRSVVCHALEFWVDMHLSADASGTAFDLSLGYIDCAVPPRENKWRGGRTNECPRGFFFGGERWYCGDQFKRRVNSKGGFEANNYWRVTGCDIYIYLCCMACVVVSFLGQG